MFYELSIPEFEKLFPLFLESNIAPSVLAELRNESSYRVRFGNDKNGRFALEFGFTDDHWHLFK